MLLRIYFSATILLPSTAPKRGPPLVSRKQNTRRFASHHLQTPGHLIGDKERSNSGKPKIPRVICCNSSGLAETFSRTGRLCPLPRQGLIQSQNGGTRSNPRVNRKYGQGLADEPEVVTVVLVSGDGGSIYRLVVAPNDVDRIVGKNNHTVRSMRVILSAIGAKLNRKVSLEIGE
jgi:predicted RNA-binding protein YlqC (UPF0109 family)